MFFVIYLSVLLSVAPIKYVFVLKEEKKEGRKEERNKIYLPISQCHSTHSPLSKFPISVGITCLLV